MPFSKHRRGHTLFMIAFFICLGITTEVFFTAFTALFTGERIDNKPVGAMAGVSYVWMALIYGLIPILGHFIHGKVKHLHVAVRVLFYVFLIYLIEFVSGYLLRACTGNCPWEYTTGWHIMGLIRLDYLPAWAFFAWMVESLYVFVNNKVIQ